ncbi:hypothetical protein ACFLS8_00435 [Chloroflexota bacterium]
MLWWQIVLVIFLSIVIGLLAGAVISYIISRIQKRPLSLPQPFSEKTGFLKTSEPLVQSEASIFTQEQPQPPATPTTSWLMAEIEVNYQTASTPWTGKLLPFQTSVWDNGQHDIPNLKMDDHEDLLQAYTAMNYANSIILLATDLGRCSENLEKHYVQLCQMVTSKLERVLESVRQLES